MFSITVPETTAGEWRDGPGPDFFATDDGGMLLSPIATAFPKYRVCVTGREIHAIQTEIPARGAAKSSYRGTAGEMGPDQEDGVYGDAVSLFTRGPMVLIRSVPEAMEQAFAADELCSNSCPRTASNSPGSISPPSAVKTAAAGRKLEDIGAPALSERDLPGHRGQPRPCRHWGRLLRECRNRGTFPHLCGIPLHLPTVATGQTGSFGQAQGNCEPDPTDE